MLTYFKFRSNFQANKRYKRIKSVWSLSIEHESYMFLEDKVCCGF